MKIGNRRWAAVAGALLVLGMLLAPTSAPEPGGDHPPDMNCGSVLRPITPAPDLADPDFEFYREKMDRGCQAARTTRVVVTVLVAGLAMVGLRLWRRRGGVNA